MLLDNREDIQIKPGQATVKDDQEKAIQIRHVQIITYFYLAEEMLEKQPGEPINLICRPEKEKSDKRPETRACGKRRLLPSLLQRAGMWIIN